MRIGVNCFLLEEHIGGLRQYFIRLFNELLKIDKSNKYIFFYFDHNVSELKHIVNDKWKEDAIKITDQKDVLKYLDKIDLYFCPFGSIWPRPVPLPSVVTLVDVQEKFYPCFFSKEDIWNREFHYVASTRAADQVITISNFSRESIAQHHHISINKIHTIYLAADESFCRERDKYASDLKLPEKYIFYPANRWFHKNHDNLLKALLILKKEKNKIIDCVFTGFDYAGGYPLNDKVIEYGLASQIHVVGYVAEADLKHIYRNAQMLCFPSLFEGFGMPLVEAMNMGCPIICSNNTSIPEVVGNAALQFNPNDPADIAAKIFLLWNNEELRSKLITLSTFQAKNFSVRNLAEQHIKVFDLAMLSFRKHRYVYYRYVGEPLHVLKMFAKR